MEHSVKYSKVKRWFDLGVWPEARVKNAVKMGWITEEEFKTITGNDYTA